MVECRLSDETVLVLLSISRHFLSLTRKLVWFKFKDPIYFLIRAPGVPVNCFPRPNPILVFTLLQAVAISLGWGTCGGEPIIDFRFIMFGAGRCQPARTSSFSFLCALNMSSPIWRFRTGYLPVSFIWPIDLRFKIRGVALSLIAVELTFEGSQMQPEICPRYDKTLTFTSARDVIDWTGT
jgi:hypothetical protein